MTLRKSKAHVECTSWVLEGGFTSQLGPHYSGKGSAQYGISFGPYVHFLFLHSHTIKIDVLI